MKHIILAALMLAASPAMAGDYSDEPGWYKSLMLGIDDSELPPVPQGGPYGELSVTRDVEAPSAKLPISGRE